MAGKKKAKPRTRQKTVHLDEIVAYATERFRVKIKEHEKEHPKKKCGRPPIPLEQKVRGLMMFVVLGISWRKLEYVHNMGPWETYYGFFNTMSKNGILDEVLRDLIITAYEEGKIDMRDLLIDSSTVKAMVREDGVGRDGNKKITGTKIHLVTIGDGTPVFFHCHAANEHDSPKMRVVLDMMQEWIPEYMWDDVESAKADKGYDAEANRKYLEDHGIEPHITPRETTTHDIPDWVIHQWSSVRSAIERTFNTIKNGHPKTRLRFEKKLENFEGMVSLALIRMYSIKMLT